MEGDSVAGGRRLLVLGAGAAQLGLLEAAQARHLVVIAVDRDPAAPGFRFADRRAIVSVEDEPGIERLAQALQPDGVIAPGIDWPVAIAARIAERLGLDHPISPATAVLATSKLRQRERFAEAGVPQPRNAVARDEAEAIAAADEIGYPCVVKAPDRQGQKGLALARSHDEVHDAVRSALAAARSGLCLVEELVDGPEVTVNGFSVGGRFVPLTVTDRLVAESPAFGVALAHAWPSRDADGAAEVAQQAVDALGIENGPSYTQLRIGPDGAKVMEVAARLGGGHDAELCRIALGVDLNALALAAALGEQVPPFAPEPQVGGACVRFIVPPVGALEAVEGEEEARAAEGVVDVRLYRQPGYIFLPLRRGADRAGAILAVGADRDEALQRADAAAARIRFITVDAEALV